MHYLFGFSGRMNRAKMWLFIPVTLAWKIIIAIVAAVGFRWTDYGGFGGSSIATGPHSGTALSVHFRFMRPEAPDNPVAWAALGIVAVLVLAYFVALFAVCTRRLHDRDKGAVWLIPFVLIPWGVGVLKCTHVPHSLMHGPLLGPLGMGMGAAGLIGTVLFLWAVVELFFLRGTNGSNRYGPDPLAR